MSTLRHPAKLKQRQQAKEFSKELTRKVSGYLSLPQECSSCSKPFNKQIREQRDSWMIQQFEDNLILLCPECHEKKMKLVEDVRTSLENEEK